MRATRMLFAISDTFAWLVATSAAVAGVAAPFVMRIQAQRMQREPDIQAVAITVVLCLTVAAGAFLIARRRIAGLPLMLLSACFFAFNGEFVTAAVLASGVLVVFGLPHWLVMRHASNSQPSNN